MEENTSPFKYNITTVSEDPLIVYIDNFLSDTEIESIFQAAPELERSTGGLSRSVSSYRTSSTAWVNTEAISNVTLREALYDIEDRIADITGFPVENQVCMCVCVCVCLMRVCVCVCVFNVCV